MHKRLIPRNKQTMYGKTPTCLLLKYTGFPNQRLSPPPPQTPIRPELSNMITNQTGRRQAARGETRARKHEKPSPKMMQLPPVWKMIEQLFFFIYVYSLLSRKKNITCVMFTARLWRNRYTWLFLCTLTYEVSLPADTLTTQITCLNSFIHITQARDPTLSYINRKQLVVSES